MSHPVHPIPSHAVSAVVVILSSCRVVLFLFRRLVVGLCVALCASSDVGMFVFPHGVSLVAFSVVSDGELCEAQLWRDLPPTNGNKPLLLLPFSPSTIEKKNAAISRHKNPHAGMAQIPLMHKFMMKIGSRHGAPFLTRLLAHARSPLPNARLSLPCPWLVAFFCESTTVLCCAVLHVLTILYVQYLPTRRSFREPCYHPTTTSCRPCWSLAACWSTTHRSTARYCCSWHLQSTRAKNLFSVRASSNFECFPRSLSPGQVFFSHHHILV